MTAMCEVLTYLGVVLVQDALEVAELYPENPVYRYLLDKDPFQ